MSFKYTAKGVLSVTLAAAMALTGCSKAKTTAKETAASDTTTVRIAFCVKEMLESIPDVLREKFPDVNFEFTLANNNADYYKYLADHDDLPDIITVRRFSLLDAVELKDKLLDLSKTDLAASYYQNYLQNYTYEDGTVNWLPALAEVWCILANKTLFEENDIDIPTDYASFIDACEKFEELGIQGYTSDWSYDYTALETLEGFNIAALQSLDGRKWRTSYESRQTETLDETIWPTAFEHMQDMLESTGNVASDAESAETLIGRGFSEVQTMMDSRQVAMIRSSGSEVVGYNERNDDEYILLPYFGETQDDNWLLTYPYYQAAISSESKVDSKLLMEIYTYMYSQEAQDSLGLGMNMLSYTSNVKAEPNEYLQALSSYIDENKVFIRLANNDFFSAAKTAVQGMITGDYDADEAYSTFNAALKEAEADPEMDLKLDKGYDFSFDAEHGSQSTSAILNSCRQVWGTDFAVTYPEFVSNSVYAGELSSSQLGYLLGGNYAQNYYLELTGAQIEELLSVMVHYITSADNDSSKYSGLNPVSDNMLPVTSGLEIEVSKTEDGYKLDKVTANGGELSDDEKYTIVYSVQSYYAQFIASQAGIELPEGSVDVVPKMKDTLSSWLVEQKKQLEEPTDYIKLK